MKTMTDDDKARDAATVPADTATDATAGSGTADSIPAGAGVPAKGPDQKPGEIGGPQGPEPTRYGDWEFKGRCTDF